MILTNSNDAQTVQLTILSSHIDFNNQTENYSVPKHKTEHVSRDFLCDLTRLKDEGFGKNLNRLDLGIICDI